MRLHIVEELLHVVVGGHRRLVQDDRLRLGVIDLGGGVRLVRPLLDQVHALLVEALTRVVDTKGLRHTLSPHCLCRPLGVFQGLVGGLDPPSLAGGNVSFRAIRKASLELSQARFGRL